MKKRKVMAKMKQATKKRWVMMRALFWVFLPILFPSTGETAPKPIMKVVSTATVVEWQLQDGTVVSGNSGALGSTGVTVEVRPTATANGTRYDVRLRNRTGTDYNHVALRVRLPRAGSEGNALIEGLPAALPAEIRQGWENSSLEGSKYGFSYEVKSGAQTLKKAGPSSTEGQWGGRASGIVRIDGKAYVVPEFWERQPRRITVTAGEVIIGLFEGADKKWAGAETFEPLRAGEDVWDRFAIIDKGSLTDGEIKKEAEGLTQLSVVERETLVTHFGIAPEGLKGKNAEAEALLRKYDLWQGTSWEKRYADEMPARMWAGDEDSLRTTLFSLFARGWYYAVANPGIYTWREYGDIQWACDKSSLHYDWLRAALKHYLKTGNEDALRWGMAAMRHAVAVDHLWENPAQPARNDYINLAGLTRYEKGDHGGNDFIARQTHSWVEGLFLAHAVSGDPWVRETAVDLAEADWRVWDGAQPASWDGGYAETRMVTWPLLVQVIAARETGNAKYWQKARELMAVLLQNEQRSGGKGYVTNPLSGIGNENNAYTLMNGYSVRGMVAFAEEALRRGEWKAEYTNLMQRWATWLTTPVPNGAYFPNGNSFTPPNPAFDYGTYVYAFCPQGLKCTLPTSTSGEVVYNMMISDLFSWLAVNDPNGVNPNTKQTWDELARLTFYDSVNHGPQPYGTVGFLTNMYPTTETKALGWMQLFQDRTAMYLADSSPSPAPCDYSLSPYGQNFGTSGGTGTVNVTTPGGCGFSAASNASWITIAPAVAAAPGTSNGVVNYSVTQNTSPNSRTGTLTIAGRTFTVNQEGQPCTYSISPTQKSLPSAGGTGNVLVSTPAGCGWTAESGASWITLTSGSSGSGNGQVNYLAAANDSTSPRTGTVTIAGQTFTVNQEAQTCGYSLSPAAQSFSSSEATGTVGVTAASGCGWTAASQAAWISVTSGNSGKGNGKVGYSVKANANSGSRTGALTIAGQTFKVTQPGNREFPVIAVEPHYLDFGFVQRGMSVSQNLTITNKGSAPLTIRGIMVIAKTLGVFTYDQTCKTLAPGESCGFSVRFAPISRGVLKGILKVHSDAANKPVVQVQLTGRGL